MKLNRARVTNYKSIDDSGWMDVAQVSCLVGKNESGKTAFLHALKRLNPVAGVSGDFELKDYPRKGYVRYKRSHKDNPAVAITAEFDLSEEEMRRIEDSFGEGVLRSATVTVSKDYGNRLIWDFEVDERALACHVLAETNLPVEVREQIEGAETWQEMVSRLEAIKVKPTAVAELLDGFPERIRSDVRQQIIETHLTGMLPRFVYFDDYSAMRGRISIEDLRQRRDNGGRLDDADRTFLSLLALPGVELEDLESATNYEHLKAELESASIGISDEIFEFWNQNKQLRVEVDLSNANPNDPPPLNNGTILHIRIWNNRHRVSVPFDERSKGFVWFFSFLAYFSRLEESEDADLILLLDEPGLNLHAMAQKDFLRFIDSRLSPKHQVIYTTHSPFMINLDDLSRVRTVEDIDDQGTCVSNDVLTNNRETVFPLQVALGYKMAQSLLLAPRCLMVNCPSDLIYLQVLGELVASKNRVRLDPRWGCGQPADVHLAGGRFVRRRRGPDGCHAEDHPPDRVPEPEGLGWAPRPHQVGRGDQGAGRGHRGPLRAELLPEAGQRRLCGRASRQTDPQDDLGQQPADRSADFGILRQRGNLRRQVRHVPARGVPAAGVRGAQERDRRRHHRAGRLDVRSDQRASAV